MNHNIYTYALAELKKSPLITRWPEMEEHFQRRAACQPRDWKLPVVACEAVGGTWQQALPAATAIACLQISIILIDDILDHDERGYHKKIGEGRAANLAAAFQAAGTEIIAQSQVNPAIQLAVLDSLNKMVLTTALGQHWDSQNPADEEAYWQLVRTKSSPFYGTAFQLGALLGGASFELADQIREIGYLYGEIIQIHDDLNDSFAVPANPDWVEDRSPLPVLFAQVVTHPDRARFFELRQSIPDPSALAEAQQILLRCGAVSYSIDQLLRRHQIARDKLAAIPLVQCTGLSELLEELVKPVWLLFQSMGVEEPERMVNGAIHDASRNS